jgi:hypothetical protein
MSVRAKTVFIIVVTLIIGILIGTFVLVPPIAKHHFKRIASMRRPEGFIKGMEHVIRPSESQAEAVNEVLDRYSRQFDEINDRHHAEMTALMDSLRSDLTPILTDEQNDRLDELAKRARHFVPPPGERPGKRH